MLASNQPYGRVSDGIGAGLFSGALVGAAAAGATDAFGVSGLNYLSERNVKRFTAQSNKIGENFSNGKLSTQKSLDNLKKLSEKSLTSEARLEGARQFHGKAFGGWKGRAASYGGSILAGAVIGTAGDALI